MAERQSNVLVLSGVRTGRRCGVYDYSEQLGEAIGSVGGDVEVVNAADWSLRSTLRLAARLIRHKGVVHAQFPSQSMSQRAAPYIVLAAALSAKRVVTFHEFSRMTWRGKALALPSLLLARRIIATHKGEAEAISGTFPFVRHKVCCVPIGSNIPVARSSAGRTVDVCFFGMIGDNPQVRGFLDIVRRADLAASAVLMGHAKMADPRTAGIVDEARALGVTLALDLPSDQVAAMLANSKVAVLPYEDGISERRGSALAAMANGALVVTTPPQSGDPRAFDALCLMATDLAELTETTRRALAHYDEHADIVRNARRYAGLRSWDRIAAEHVRLYRGQAPRARYQPATT